MRSAPHHPDGAADGRYTRREISREFIHHAVHSGVLEDFLRDHDAVTSDPA